MKLGELGCVASHYELYKSLTGCDFVTIFEDDAQVVDLKGLVDFLNKVPKTFDILLLGYNSILVRILGTEGYKTVGSFWGSHALILNVKARKYFMDEYDKMMSINTCLPTDDLLSHCISKYKLKCFAPLKPCIIQIEGLISSISGRPRKNTNYQAKKEK